MAKPAIMPRPDSIRLIAIKTSIPSPFAPIMAQVTTIATAIIIVWLIPVMIVGSA